MVDLMANPRLTSPYGGRVDRPPSVLSSTMPATATAPVPGSTENMRYTPEGKLRLDTSVGKWMPPSTGSWASAGVQSRPHDLSVAMAPNNSADWGFSGLSLLSSRRMPIGPSPHDHANSFSNTSDTSSARRISPTTPVSPISPIGNSLLSLDGKDGSWGYENEESPLKSVCKSVFGVDPGMPPATTAAEFRTSPLRPSAFMERHIFDQNPFARPSQESLLLGHEFQYEPAKAVGGLVQGFGQVGCFTSAPSSQTYAARAANAPQIGAGCSALFGARALMQPGPGAANPLSPPASVTMEGPPTHTCRIRQEGAVARAAMNDVDESVNVARIVRAFAPQLISDTTVAAITANVGSRECRMKNWEVLNETCLKQLCIQLSVDFVNAVMDKRTFGEPVKIPLFRASEELAYVLANPEEGLDNYVPPWQNNQKPAMSVLWKLLQERLDEYIRLTAGLRGLPLLMPCDDVREMILYRFRGARLPTMKGSQCHTTAENDCTRTMVRLTNVDYTTKKRDVLTFLYPIVVFPSDVHIPIHLSTGKMTYEIYLDFPTANLARSVVQLTSGHTLLSRRIEAGLVNVEAMLVLLFGRTHKQIDETTVFIPPEAQQRMWKLCWNAKNTFNGKTPSRPFEHILSCVQSLPWHDSHLGDEEKARACTLLKVAIRTLRSYDDRKHAFAGGLVSEMVRIVKQETKFTRDQKAQIEACARNEEVGDYFGRKMAKSQSGPLAGAAERPINRGQRSYGNGSRQTMNDGHSNQACQIPVTSAGPTAQQLSCLHPHQSAPRQPHIHCYHQSGDASAASCSRRHSHDGVVRRFEAFAQEESMGCVACSGEAFSTALPQFLWSALLENERPGVIQPAQKSPTSQEANPQSALPTTSASFAARARTGGVERNPCQSVNHATPLHC